jgi:tRNA (guanosine-2'-O-)-methyltransferase
MEVTSQLKKGLTTERIAKFEHVAAWRQNMTVILENVHDPHNIGAVIRSCDAVGISEIFVLNTEKEVSNYYVGKKSSTGARKWVDVHYYDDRISCFKAVRQKYSQIYGTHLSETASSLYDLNLTESVALMFGNEHAGISEESMKELDGNFIIPQYGLVQSLNISVACAVSLYEASRQRFLKGMYENKYNEDNSQHRMMLDKYLKTHLKE